MQVESGWNWRPLTVADLFDDVFKVYRARFGLFFAVSVIVLVPVALAQALFMAPAADALDAWQLLVSGTVGAGLTEQIPLADAPNFGASSASAIISLLSSSLLVSTVAGLTVEHLHGRRPGFGDAFAAGFRNVWRVMGTYVLLALVFIGVIIVVGIVALVLSFALGPIVGTVLAVLLSLIALAVTAIALGVRWLLAPAVIVAEDAGVGAAIKRSFALSRGAVWSLLGRYLLFTIMVGILTALPGMVISAFVAVAFYMQSVGLIFAATGLLGALISAFVQPLLPIVLTLMYFDRRVRTEGYDLQQMAGQLES